MKIYGKRTVLEAALDRIRWLFDEFETIIVGFSGGKDSTVTLGLALQVAREKGRLPLKVMFLDQEAEWQSTIDIVQQVMESPEVDPLWFQIPIRLFNATSTTEHWLYCWDAKDEDRWMRPRWERAYTENRYGTDRFGEMFGAIVRKEFPDQRVCYLAGVRCEESPSRAMGLTYQRTYKWATWGKALDKRRGHFTMYPLYDWTTSDVWKAIFEHGWAYNTLYDTMYSMGVPVRDMRVSNVHHETAVTALFRLQEIEPETYARLTQRIAGIDMAGKMNFADYFPSELPPMFRDWREYRDFLLEKLIPDPAWVASFRAQFARQDEIFAETEGAKLWRMHVTCILTNDWENVKSGNYERAPQQLEVKRARKRRLAAEQEAGNA